MTYTIKTDLLEYKFSNIGAELISAKSNNGNEFIWIADPDVWPEHSPVLFPICGRLLNGEYSYKGKNYKMGCHGFFSSSTVTVVEQTRSMIKFRLSSNEKTLAVYPFDFELDITYTAHKNKLTIAAEVKNTGIDILPFMYGGHPGFNLPFEKGLVLSDHKVKFEKNRFDIHHQQNTFFVNPIGEEFYLDEGVLTLDEDMIEKAGTLIFKNSGNKVILFSDKSNKNIEVLYDNNFDYLCMWKYPGERAAYICIEPWSGTPSDGLVPEDFETRGSMVRINSGEAKKFVYEIVFND